MNNSELSKKGLTVCYEFDVKLPPGDLAMW